METRNIKKATTVAAAAVNSPADDDEKALTTTQSHPRLVRIMEEANYEVYVDPYRGIVPFFSVSFSNNDQNNEANYLGGSCGGTVRGRHTLQKHSLTPIITIQLLLSTRLITHIRRSRHTQHTISTKPNTNTNLQGRDYLEIATLNYSIYFSRTCLADWMIAQSRSTFTSSPRGT